MVKVTYPALDMSTTCKTFSEAYDHARTIAARTGRDVCLRMERIGSFVGILGEESDDPVVTASHTVVTYEPAKTRFGKINFWTVGGKLLDSVRIPLKSDGYDCPKEIFQHVSLMTAGDVRKALDELNSSYDEDIGATYRIDVPFTDGRGYESVYDYVSRRCKE